MVEYEESEEDDGMVTVTFELPDELAEKIEERAEMAEEKRIQDKKKEARSHPRPDLMEAGEGEGTE
jgi:hypothetical protein